jgi:hypothetical protein
MGCNFSCIAFFFLFRGFGDFDLPFGDFDLPGPGDTDRALSESCFFSSLPLSEVDSPVPSEVVAPSDLVSSDLAIAASCCSSSEIFRIERRPG